MLTGGYQAEVMMDSEDWDKKTEKGRICLLLLSFNAGVLKKKTIGSQRCGGHRGGVGRVKSGKG